MRAIAVISLLLLVVSCNTPNEPPVFKGVRNIKVNKMEGTKALVDADAHFYNPNDVNMRLKSVDVGVHLDGKAVGVIKESFKTKIPASSDFKVPLKATFNLKGTGLLNSILSMLGGQKRTVRYVGYIRVAVHGVTIRVPVDYESKISL